MKRRLFPIIIILSMVLSLSGSVRSVRADTLLPFPDLDQDGISNTMENNGWYNLPGVLYHTDPDKADSDGDGLTDGEEKLFNTNPNNLESPGISVKYDSAYKTFEYYNTTDPAYLAMVQGGNQYLLTEALVVRRGTTFNISAVNSDAATLTISGSGLTALTPVRDPARGGWDVTVSPNGTVGNYTATVTLGAWSKSMPIYVIFALPTDLTQTQINTYLYDDDPANKRDEVAVWFRQWDYQYYFYNNGIQSLPPNPADCQSGTPGICSADRYHTSFGYAQAFWTEQFTKKVLLDFTLPVIRGKTNQYDATIAISDKADASVRVNYGAQLNSFSSATTYYHDPALGYHMGGGACETNTGVFTSMLRSAGITARPFLLSYNKTPGHGENGNFGSFEYDHATMMWVRGPGDPANRWYAERTSVQDEDEYQPTPQWVGGVNGIRPLDEVGIYNPADPLAGFGKFRDLFADLIKTVNEGWDFQNGSLGGGMVNIVWPIPPDEFNNSAAPDPYLNRDDKWESIEPLKMVYQSPYIDLLTCQLWNGDVWAPGEWYDQADPRYYSNPVGRNASGTYFLPAGIPAPGDSLENWPYNPKPNACSPSSVDDAACTDAFKNGSITCPLLPGQTLAGAQQQQFQPEKPDKPALNSTIQLMNIISDAGLDRDDDGRFDKLVVTFELNSSVEGEYQLGGWLTAGEKVIRADTNWVTLISGLQTVQIAFDGQLIGDNQVDGPYQVGAIWVAPADQAVSDLALPEEMAAYLTYEYATQAYQAGEFIVLAASIADNFTYSSVDEDANGLIDSITISVPLDIAIPGTFTVEGDLYDGQGRFVGHAKWTGEAPTALLIYDVKESVPPYSLEHLNLIDARGKWLDARYAPVYTIKDLSGRVDQGTITLRSGSTIVTSPSAITPSNTFTATPVDSNANGRYDQLVVSAGVDVTDQGGSFWMEGLLVDSHGSPVAWGVGAPQTLGVGQNQTLQMAYDGRMLFDQLPLTGTQPFTLVALKIFSGNPGLATLEADVPVPGFVTAAYSRAQFELPIASTLFQDDMEAGETNWNITGSSQWSRIDHTWRSWSHAWIATGSNSRNGLLTLATPLDLTNYDSPWLRFSTAYRLLNNQSVKLEVSTDGSHWTTIKTYTESTTYWTTEMVDLSAYRNKAGVRFRFNAQSNPGAIWYIDDVFVYDWLAIQYIPLLRR